MNIRRKALLLCPLLLFFGFCIWFLCTHFAKQQKYPTLSHSPQKNNEVRTNIVETNAPANASIAERRRMSNEQRLRWLEQNGKVPEDADNMDWYLAQKTSWWGKPIDPKAFWAGRVIWNDESAEKESQRYGRRFPPIPSDELKYAKFSTQDSTVTAESVEGRSYNFHENYREIVFWQDFFISKPKPPADLNYEVSTQAKEYFQPFAGSNQDSNRLQIVQVDVQESAKRLNYPPEAFTREALFWAYVMDERQDYENKLRLGPLANNPIASRLLSEVAVDSKLITNGLSPDEIKLAKAWKIAYLKRLQSQGVDQSYINAYMQAWNLSSKDISGSGH